MADKNTESTPPRYVWPWFVGGAVLLGFVLAVVWMTIEVRRIRQQRSANPWSAPAATGTNLAK